MLGQGNIERVYTAALSGFVLQSSSKKAIKELGFDKRIDFIEVDQTVSVNTTQFNATWGLDRIDQENLPLNNTYIYDQNGSGVTAYIIDTGIRQTHVQFDSRASGGFTSISDGNGTNDCNGHGTHVAGTVGSSTYGVAKNVDLIAVRVLDCAGEGTFSGVIAGVDWVAANHTSTSVANMSLGGGISTALDSAVNGAVASGITMVVAAGNNTADACGFSPARAANAITVGSTDSIDRRSSFSNFGTCLDIFAPGTSITSTWSTSNSSTNTISGTSMASPHVAGVAALYLDEHPGASPAQVQTAIEDAASVNKLTDVRSGSPNLLLNNNLDGNNSVTPDQYDDISIRGFTDDVPGDAVRLFAGASAQLHNFHDAGDQDWTIFAMADGSHTINTAQLGTASARLTAYRISPFPTETSPGRWDISLSDLTQVASDQSNGNNTVTIINNTGLVQGYVIKATSSGSFGSDTDYQINSISNPATPDQFDDISIRGFTDDVPGDAERLFAGASAQLHNFYDVGDQDWTIFAMPDGSHTINTTQLGTASARLSVYRVSPFPTEITPGRWDISLSDLTLVASDQSNGNNSVTVQNNTGEIQAYVIKATSSGPVGHNTDYQIISTSNPATPDQFDDISIRGFTDDVPGDVERLFAGASAQLHNFHDAGDQDWTIFAMPNGIHTINTTQLGTASARLSVYVVSPFPTEITPDRWDISLSDLTLVASDQSNGSNSVTIQNSTGTVQAYVVKATSSGAFGHNTDYQIVSSVQ